MDKTNTYSPGFIPVTFTRSDGNVFKVDHGYRTYTIPFINKTTETVRISGGPKADFDRGPFDVKPGETVEVDLFKGFDDSSVTILDFKEHNTPDALYADYSVLFLNAIKSDIENLDKMDKGGDYYQATRQIHMCDRYKVEIVDLLLVDGGDNA